MITFIIRRVLRTILLLLVVSIITFCIFFLIPRLAGQTSAELAAQYVGRNPTASAIQQMEVKLGLNEPLPVQYWQYLVGHRGGPALQRRPERDLLPAAVLRLLVPQPQPVWPQMVSALPVTAVAGHRRGHLVAARRRLDRRAVRTAPGQRLCDRFSMGIALAGVSLPIFFTGADLARAVRFKWPIFPDSEYVNIAVNPLQWSAHLVLPWITLAFLYAALYARLTRAGMLETLSEDFIRTARAKGLRERSVIVKHGLRAALTPILTIFGMDLGLLLGGAILTETTFSCRASARSPCWRSRTRTSRRSWAWCMLAAFFIVIANMVVDILYAVIDPRVRTA